MSDLLRDSVFYWTFSSTTGDAYTGYTVADTASLGGLPVGALLPSPYGPAFGAYTVTNIVNYEVDLSAHFGIGYYAEGATVLSSYYDANTARSLPTYYGSQGIPTTYGGLGEEFDFVPVPFFGIPGAQPGGYFEVGYGGYYLIA